MYLLRVMSSLRSDDLHRIQRTGSSLSFQPRLSRYVASEMVEPQTWFALLRTGAPQWNIPQGTAVSRRLIDHDFGNIIIRVALKIVVILSTFLAV